MTQFFPSGLNAYPVSAPYVAALSLLNSIVQGDSTELVDLPFTDVNGNSYSSGNAVLKYVLAGAVSPLTLTAIASGSSWQTNLTAAQSAALTPGNYSWTVQIFPTGGGRTTLSSGELIVTPDLASAAAGYDGRSQAEIALSQAKAALANFGASGGVKMYTIGNRQMEFSRDKLIDEVNFWRAQVQAEQIKAKGVRGRMIGVRFNRAR
jgi:hypothetical protein